MSLDPTQKSDPEQQEPGAPEQPEPAPPEPAEALVPEQPGPYYEYQPSENAAPAGDAYPPYGNVPPAGDAYPPYGAPYYPPYPSGAPQGLYRQAPFYGMPQKPLPLIDAIAQLPLHYWKVLSKPSARVFAEESGRAKWDITLVQLIGYILIDGLLGWLHNTLYPLVMQPAVLPANTNGLSQAEIDQIQSATVAIASFITGPGLFILVPLGFLLYQGVAFGIARAFGGRGTFLAQSYSTLLIYVPIGLITIALSYIDLSFGPLGIIGGLVGLALELYGIFLSVFAMMGVHRLTSGKASATALLPFAALLLVVCCILTIVVFVIAGNAVQP